jgi:hypothetical protein
LKEILAVFGSSWILAALCNSKNDIPEFCFGPKLSFFTTGGAESFLGYWNRFAGFGATGGFLKGNDGVEVIGAVDLVKSCL